MKFSTYDRVYLDSSLYLNEGFNTYLCWKNLNPKEAIKMKKINLSFVTSSFVASRTSL